MSVGCDGRIRLDGQHGMRVLAIAVGSHAILRDTTVENGRLDVAGNVGAGIRNDGRITLDTVILRGHRLGSTGVDGAALYNAVGASAQLDDCMFTDNRGNTSGAIANAGELHLLRGLLQNNAGEALNAGGRALSNSGTTIVRETPPSPAFRTTPRRTTAPPTAMCADPCFARRSNSDGRRHSSRTPPAPDAAGDAPRAMDRQRRREGDWRPGKRKGALRRLFQYCQTT